MIEISLSNINDLQLSNFSLNKLNNYQKKKSKNIQSLTSYYLLDNLLSKHNLSIKDIYYDNGKPLLNNYYLSISHKDNYVAVALSDQEIGIDIEHIKDINQNIINQICNSKEQEIITKSNNKNKTFYQIFTTKESISKITGLGLKSISNIDSTSSNYQIKHIYFDNYILTIVKRGIL